MRGTGQRAGTVRVGTGSVCRRLLEPPDGGSGGTTATARQRHQVRVKPHLLPQPGQEAPAARWAGQQGTDKQETVPCSRHPAPSVPPAPHGEARSAPAQPQRRRHTPPSHPPRRRVPPPHPVGRNAARTVLTSSGGSRRSRRVRNRSALHHGPPSGSPPARPRPGREATPARLAPQGAPASRLLTPVGGCRTAKATPRSRAWAYGGR
jgi:hypothetical protein